MSQDFHGPVDQVAAGDIHNHHRPPTPAELAQAMVIARRQIEYEEARAAERRKMQLLGRAVAFLAIGGGVIWASRFAPENWRLWMMGFGALLVAGVLKALEGH